VLRANIRVLNPYKTRAVKALFYVMFPDVRNIIRSVYIIYLCLDTTVVHNNK